MSMFKDMLKNDETLFTSNVEALDFDYIPKAVPFRENEQRQVAMCIKPLFQKRNGRNILVHGKPGVGKTVAIKHLLKEIEEESDEVYPTFINCWQKNTSYKIMLDLCDQLGYKFTQSKNTDDLLDIVVKIANDNSGVVLVFDEIDKVVDLDFLYMLLERLYRKTIVLITNYKSWLDNLDERIKSRLIPDVLEFKEYNIRETTEILRGRLKYAFVANVWNDDAFVAIANKTNELKDIRTGLFLMKEAAQIAEDKSKKKVSVEEAKEAIHKLEEFTPKDKSDLLDADKELLDIIKENSESKIGDLFKLYSEIKEISYKTFQRKIKALENNNLISVKKISGGKDGATSIITYGGVKRLTDF
ncbi:AAA family ATPase [Candidatus Woesearchaeota archaeon]|nr:AAA family ATPase [Candidatus Woesearchaeota archaeon]